MDITITFFVSLIIAFIGVIPPGLLNMTAAKISVKEGYSRALMFSAGACVIVGVQTVIAVIFARYLSRHHEIINILQRVAFVIFVLITIYFLTLANKQGKKEVKIKREPRSKNSRFFFGMFMSVLNVFPIPYQAYMSLTVAPLGWLTFDTLSMSTYVAGAVMGSFVTFYLYVLFFDKIKSQRIKSQKNMSRMIGVVTGVISIITLIKILRDF